MEKKIYSLKDFELSYEKNAIERAEDFQMYIHCIYNRLLLNIL